MSGVLTSAVALPSGPAYTVVLMCHVAAVLIGMVTMVAGAAFASWLLVAGDGPLPPSVRSYFSPGANWAGRVLYLVPVCGAALLAMSGGAYRAGSDWVLTGIGLWVVAIGLAEAVLWPAEQRVRRALAAAAAAGAPGVGPPAVTAAPTSEPTGAGVPAVVGATRVVVPSDARDAARTVVRWSVVVLVVLVVAAVVMVAKP